MSVYWNLERLHRWEKDGGMPALGEWPGISSGHLCESLELAWNQMQKQPDFLPYDSKNVSPPGCQARVGVNPGPFLTVAG